MPWAMMRSLPSSRFPSWAPPMFRVPKPVEPCALFCDEDEFGCHLEVNPRVDGSVYVCGCGGSKYLDESQLRSLAPDEVFPDPQRVKAASAALRSKISVADGVEPEANACIRPCPPDARPMLGPVGDNAFVACGHNCWGILWGPLTGQIMAELVTGGEPPAPRLGAPHLKQCPRREGIGCA
ncbi:unnamed protein product [Prorocentrum cordatum]|uniref:FAD dependent oxidoreductase domain-containing protein n=1 Tax=Prorocentrum cordatum TaxID=2364126 RepID=A0ABN9QQ03_9DINO|nr:unnamed protein product [Polarella glacialis]